MSKKEEELKRDNYEETKKGMKEINKILFRNNDDLPDDWTDFQLSPEEVKILKEGENYIEKVLAPNLSIYRKATKEELADNERPIKTVKKEKTAELEINEKQAEKTFSEDEITEINNLLKQKTKNLKLKAEVESKDKYKKLKDEEEKKKREELERLNR